MFVPRRDGESGEDPFAEGDEKRIAAKVIDNGDEEQMFEDQLRPEVWFACNKRSDGRFTTSQSWLDDLAHRSRHNETILRTPYHPGYRTRPSGTILPRSVPWASGSPVQSCR